jgi:hypothetical protein
MWIKTNAKFRGEGISDAEWENYTPEQKDDNCEIAKYRFDTTEVVCYNDTNYSGKPATAIRYKNGDSVTVLMTIEELDSKICPTQTADDILNTIK